eukprot:2375232-Prymnesium_polylepis.1
MASNSIAACALPGSITRGNSWQSCTWTPIRCASRMSATRSSGAYVHVRALRWTSMWSAAPTSSTMWNSRTELVPDSEPDLLCWRLKGLCISPECGVKAEFRFPPGLAISRLLCSMLEPARCRSAVLHSSPGDPSPSRPGAPSSSNLEPWKANSTLLERGRSTINSEALVSSAAQSCDV